MSNSSFPQFASAVARYKIKKNEDLVPEGKAHLRIHPIGYKISRVFIETAALIPLLKDISARLPLTADGPQPVIGTDNGKIVFLMKEMNKTIEDLDKVLPSQSSCMPFYKKANDVLNQIQQFIPHLTNKNAPSMAKHLDSISQAITAISDFLSKILENLIKCEAVLAQKIKAPTSQQLPLVTNIATTLTAFEKLFIDIIFVSSLSKVQSSKDIQNVIKTIGEKVRSFSDALFNNSREKSINLLAVIYSLNAKMPLLTNFVGMIQPIIPNTSEFSKLGVSMITTLQTINELYVRLQLKGLMELIKNVTAAFINKKPLDSAISQAKTFLSVFEEKFKDGEKNGISPNILAAYTTLKTTLNNCSQSSEFAATTVLSICGFIAILFPDARISEDLLISITQKISLITKQIFKEAKDLFTKLGEIIDSSLEYFPEKPLAAVNFYLAAMKNIKAFNTDAEDFVIQQQTCFDLCAGLPTVLTKLISETSDQATKVKLSSIVKKMQPVASKFALWLNKFYAILVSIVHQRAETALAILRYPLWCIMGSNPEVDLTLTRVQATIQSFQNILKTTPQILSYDLGDVNKMISLLHQLFDSGNDFIKTVNGQSGHPAYLILHTAVQTLNKIGVALPISVQSIPSLLSFEDKYTFVIGMLACSSRALDQCRDIESFAEGADETASFMFASPFSFLLTADAMIEMSGSIGSTLVQYSAPLKTSVNAIWQTTLNIALGKNPPEASSLPAYMSTILKATSDLYAGARSLPQPLLYYKIPAKIKELQQFDELSNTLTSSALKDFAPEVVRILKEGKTDDSRNAIKVWFNEAKKPSADIAKQLAGLIKTIIKIYESGKPDTKSLSESFARFSNSMTVCTNSFGKNISPVMKEIHIDSLKAATLCFDNPGDMNQHLKLAAVVIPVKSFPEVSKLSLKDLDAFTLNNLTSIIKSLQVVRSKGKNAKTDQLIDAMYALRSLETFYELYPSPTPLTTAPSIDMLTQGTTKKAELDKSISYFSEKLDALVPLMYRAYVKIRDSDALCDTAYDKAEILKNELDHIIKLSSGGEGQEMYAACNNAFLAAADLGVLSYHAINLAGAAESSLGQQFVSIFASMINSLTGFIGDGLKKGDSNSMTSNAKAILKQSDQLVGFIELPIDQNKNSAPSKFVQMKNQLYGQLCNLSTLLSYIIELSSSAIVPEMFNDGSAQFKDLLNAELAKVERSTSAIDQKAVGEKGDFKDRLDKVNKYGSKLIGSIKDVKPGETAFPISALTECISSFSKELSKASSSVVKLTDQLAVKPDVDAAGKVPDDYIVPAAPSKPPGQQEAWSELQKQSKDFSANITKFRGSIEASTATSEELLSSIKSLRKYADRFGEAVLGMTASTPDLRSRVAQQAALYTWATNFTNVQNAIRSRLLRVPGFESEMSESLDSLVGSNLKIMKLADEASKIVATKDDAAMDKVSQQLLATSREVDALTSKMASYESQVSMEGVNGQDKKKDKDKDKEADPSVKEADLPSLKDPSNYGSLAGFLIACAKIVLRASGKIVNRSRELTHAFIEKNGNVENEMGIMRAAVDVSEAAKLLMIVADILIGGKDDEVDFKIIAAAKIINASIASLVSSVKKKGNDAAVAKQTTIVKVYTDQIIKTTEKVIHYKLDEKEKLNPKKAVNPMIQRLNMQQQVNNQRKLLEEEEKRLYQFRRTKQ